MNSLWNARGTPSSRSRFGDFTMLRARQRKQFHAQKEFRLAKGNLMLGTSYVKIKIVRYPFFSRSPLYITRKESFFFLCCRVSGRAGVTDCRFDSSLYKTPAFFLDKMTTPAMPRPFPTTHEYTHKPATRVSFYLEYDTYYHALSGGAHLRLFGGKKITNWTFRTPLLIIV